MYANSSPVQSVQAQVHVHLEAVVRRHLTLPFRRPISVRGESIFAALRPWLESQHGRPLILDSGCGTGASTRLLAQAHPDASVLGADRSLQRLRRSGLGADVHVEGALCLVRINLEDLWPLLLGAGVRLQRHLLWYPNPSPKREHLKRRWHAHPLFSTLLKLGGEIEVRSNWRVYIDEFALALTVAGQSSSVIGIGCSEPPVTPFERKYGESGHGLWRLNCAFIAAAPGTTSDPRRSP